MLTDTDPKTQARIYEMMRQATPAQKIKAMSDLNNAAKKLALADIHKKYPNAGVIFIRYQLASRMWGIETTKQLLGELPLLHE